MANPKRDNATMLKRAVGHRVRKLRHSRALTQKELALRAGVHPTYLAGIERGERNPGLENIAAIAAALEVDAVELFRSKGPWRAYLQVI